MHWYKAPYIMHMLIPSWVNVWIISKLLFIGFSIFPGNNWVLEAGREYAITVSVYDKLNHKIIVTEVSLNSLPCCVSASACLGRTPLQHHRDVL